MIKALREKLRLIWLYGLRARHFEWPPARVITRAWPMIQPRPGEVLTWHFACGDCRILFDAEVTLSDPYSFHPQCPGCIEKAQAWLNAKEGER